MIKVLYSIPLIELFAKGLAFIAIILMTHVLSIREMGIYSVVITIVMIASVFMDGGINNKIYSLILQNSWFMSCFLKKSGRKFLLNREVIIESPNKIEIGNNLQVNARCWISGGGNLKIGDNVLIGPHVVIHTANHNFKNKDILIREQGHTLKAIVIEDDVWIAANSTILPGVTIKKGTVIAAGSVITKDTEPYGVYAGVPAKKIKERK